VAACEIILKNTIPGIIRQATEEAHQEHNINLVVIAMGNVTRRVSSVVT
jgi:hypothetical protein